MKTQTAPPLSSASQERRPQLERKRPRISWSLPTNWGATPAEQAMSFPCDRYLPDADYAVFRAVEVHAPASRLFRWLCQLRVAPYSYDWLDNLGRRSPRVLIPGLQNLERGQRMLIFQLVDFEQDRQLTGLVTSARIQSIYGKIAGSYVIVAQSEQRCRLIVKLLVRSPRKGFWSLMRFLLPWGDLVMMRKQLLTLKQLAESQTVSEKTNPHPCSL
jgi:hypothetical protein